MKIFAKFLAILIFIAYGSAQAGLLLEPFVGYVSGSQKQTTTANFTGTIYGARAGFSFLRFAVGADYTGGNFTDDSTPKFTLTSGDVGGFVSYKFPILFRIYGAYVPSAKLKGSSSISSFTLQKATAMKLGLGYTGLPFVNINIEYLSSSYEEIVSSGITTPLSPKSTSTAYGVTLSAPYDFFSK